MSLSLHPECISQLEKSLAENLRHVKVNNEISVNISSILPLWENEVLPKKGMLYQQLQKYIGEVPLFNFVFETLSKELAESGKYSPESSEKLLSELPNYTDVEVLAVRLVKEFESLPWQYVVSFELPDSVGKQFRATAIPSFISSLRVIAPDDTYDSLYPLQSGSKERDGMFAETLFLLKSRAPTSWNNETAYIQIDTEGFIGRYIKTAPIEHVLGTLKSFMGLSLATRLMKIDERQTTQPFSLPPKSHLIVHRKKGDKWEICSRHELPADLSATLNALEIDNLDGEITSEHVTSWIQGRLPKIAIAFNNPGKAKRILLAAQWLLDSYVGANELLSFVQTTVAMEIMLGEESKSDVVGIGELLRNRCAYLIGNSHSQRKEILADFGRIYNVRSKIVHSGKNRLSNDERRLFRKLQLMCRRVISEELKLIEQDKGKGATLSRGQ